MEEAERPERVEVSAADIARIAGVRASAVSNWRRRNEDFPRPVGGTDRNPRFNLTEVEDWLRREGKVKESGIPLAERLWHAFDSVRAEVQPADALARAGVLLLYLQEHSDTPLPRSERALADLLAHAMATIRHEHHDSLGALVHPVAPQQLGVRERTMLFEVLDAARAASPGSTYESLCSRFFDSALRSGITATLPELAELMLDLADLGSGRLLDPACGSGAILSAAADRGATILAGQEINPALALVAALRLALRSHGIADSVLFPVPDPDFEIRSGDSLREDAFPPQSVDAVVCNPPFGDRNWGQVELADDPRWRYGLPARLESELAWVQHCLAHLRPGGHAVILMPPAAATRSSGRRIRANLLRDGALRAVISLPPRMAAHYALALQIWVLQSVPRDSLAPPDRVLLVDASGISAGPGRRQPQAEPAPAWEDLRRLISDLWARFRADPLDIPDSGLAVSVPVIDLLDDEVDVTPARHLPATASKPISPRDLARRRAELADSLRQLADLVPALPRRTHRGEAKARHVTLEELAQTGALFIRRPQPRPSDRDGREEERLAVSRVLTRADLARGGPPSGEAQVVPDEVRNPAIRAGDVLVPQIGRRLVARVATGADVGARLSTSAYLIRVDPATIDPWFLAGVLSSSDGSRQATRMASTLSDNVRFEPRRVRIPLPPLPEQQAYGEAFRLLSEFAAALRAAQEEALDFVGELTDAAVAMLKSQEPL